MVISKLRKNQGADNYRSLIKELQRETHALFFDNMMYEINDALTSILASCDVDGREAIPKIKQYIHRINQSLNNAKNLNSEVTGDRRFNIGIVLQNLIHTIKEKYKHAKMACLISDIKAPVYGDQSKFEELLLYIFINIFSCPEAFDSEMLIELRQKDQDAMITILKDSHAFQAEELQYINSMNKGSGFEGEIQITPHGQGVEVIIRIPLHFGTENIPHKNKTTPVVQKIEIKSIIKKVEDIVQKPVLSE